MAIKFITGSGVYGSIADPIIVRLTDGTGYYNASNSFTYNGTATLATFDSVTAANNRAVPQLIMKGQGEAAYTAGTADAIDCFPVTLSTENMVVITAIKTAVEALDTTGLATEVTAALILADTNTLADVDYATQTTLASVLVDTSVIAADTTSLDAKIPAQGQALMEASLPVTLASNQSNLPIVDKSALIPSAYDYIDVNLAGATTDVYTYKTGGSGGTTVATLTLTYSDATKAVLSSVARV